MLKRIKYEIEHTLLHPTIFEAVLNMARGAIRSFSPDVFSKVAPYIGSFCPCCSWQDFVLRKHGFHLYLPSIGGGTLVFMLQNPKFDPVQSCWKASFGRHGTVLGTIFSSRNHLAKHLRPYVHYTPPSTFPMTPFSKEIQDERDIDFTLIINRELSP